MLPETKMKGMSDRAREKLERGGAAEPRHRVGGNREIPRSTIERRVSASGDSALEDDHQRRGSATDHDSRVGFDASIKSTRSGVVPIVEGIGMGGPAVPGCDRQAGR
jgi:hypothetical protein